MNATTFVIAVVLACYAEHHCGATGKGTATRRRALDRFMDAHADRRGEWEKWERFDQTMKSLLSQ